MKGGLHLMAAEEALGHDVTLRVQTLLLSGADPHEMDEDGNTAFNIAAPSSPVCGRLMTNHWLSLALAGEGPKGLNDKSGSHGSTLAQYIAKWSDDNEIESQIAAAVAKGMMIDSPNASGWTPLTAAAAMGRVKAVEVFARNYSRSALLVSTSEDYETSYHGHAVVYPAGLTAEDVAVARLSQDKGLSPARQRDFKECVQILKRYANDRISKDRPHDGLDKT